MFTVPLHFKESVGKCNQLLFETYGKYAPFIKTCEYWFQRFKSDDFDTLDNRKSSKI